MVLLERAEANGAASMGKYSKGIKNLRKTFVGGNWKCNADSKFAQEFPTKVLNNIKHDTKMVDVCIAPSSLYL